MTTPTAEGAKRTLTPHQRIVRAAKRGTGLRLTADEVWTLGVMDEAIIGAARSADERDEECALARSGAV